MINKQHIYSLIISASFLAPVGLSANSIVNTGEDAVKTMQQFASKQDTKSEIVAIEDQKKREIMFYLAFPLLLCLLMTAALGVAMVVFQKQVFIAHMVFAGLSISLAIGHAVAGIVWFYPF